MSWISLQYAADFWPVPSAPPLMSGKPSFSRYLFPISRSSVLIKEYRWTCTFWPSSLQPPATTSTRAALNTTRINLVKWIKMVGESNHNFRYRQKVDQRPIIRSYFLQLELQFFSVLEIGKLGIILHLSRYRTEVLQNIHKWKRGFHDGRLQGDP